MRRDLLGLGLDLVERLHDRRHADRAGARAIGAHAELHLVGVAMHDRDIVDRNAEAIRNQLREGGFVPLPVLMAAGQHLDRAGRVDPHLGGFPQANAGAERTDHRRRRDAAGFDIGGIADAAQLALLGALALALGKALHVVDFHRLGERGVVIARVIERGDHGLIREGPHEILLAQFGRIDAEFARRDFDQPLDHEGRFRPPRAAIGIDRHGVGVDRIHLAIDRGNVVLARQQRRIEIGRHRRREGRHIGAEIGDGLHLHADDLVVLVEAEFGMGDMIAAMRVGDEGFRTVGGPFHRTRHLLRRPTGRRPLPDR